MADNLPLIWFYSTPFLSADIFDIDELITHSTSIILFIVVYYSLKTNKFSAIMKLSRTGNLLTMKFQSA